jgi:DnaJ-class molecular chaperone
MKRRKTSPLVNWHIPHKFEPNDENEWCGYCDMNRDHPDHTPDICPDCNGCGWSNPAQAIDKCERCAGSGATK